MLYCNQYKASMNALNAGRVEWVLVRAFGKRRAYANKYLTFIMISWCGKQYLLTAVRHEQVPDEQP